MKRTPKRVEKDAEMFDVRGLHRTLNRWPLIRVRTVMDGLSATLRQHRPAGTETLNALRLNPYSASLFQGALKQWQRKHHQSLREFQTLAKLAEALERQACPLTASHATKPGSFSAD